MSELEYFLSVENIEISLYAQARQSLLLLTQGNIYNRLRFLNKYLMTGSLMFLEELNELYGENWSKFLTAGYLDTSLFYSKAYCQSRNTPCEQFSANIAAPDRFKCILVNLLEFV